MDLTYSPDETAFRAEVRAWMEASVPSEALPSFDASREGFEAHRDWERKLAEGNWGMVTWPKEYGGQEGDGIYEYLLNEALAGRGAPQIGKGVGIIGKSH